MLLNEDEINRQKLQKWQQKFQKVEENKNRYIQSTIERVKKEDIKVAEKQCVEFFIFRYLIS